MTLQHSPIEPNQEPGLYDRYVGKLARLRTVMRRTSINADLKRASAEFFWDLHFPKILETKVNQKIFVEAGSSTAYASVALSDLLDRPYSAELKPMLRLETNNFLTLLEFTLAHPDLDIVLHPRGLPDNKYGATFGDLEFVPQTSPPKSPEPIVGRAKKEIDKLTRHFRSYEKNGLILMAASGVELDRGSSFRGFHVGSFCNALIKKSLLSARCPTVVFLDQDKIPSPFALGSCFPVCDNENLTWEHVCDEVPLALAIAFRRQEDAGRVLEALEILGLDHVEPQRAGERPWSVVVSNKRFVASGF